MQTLAYFRNHFGIQDSLDDETAWKTINKEVKKEGLILVRSKGLIELKNILTTNKDGRKAVFKSNGSKAYACLMEDCTKIVLKRNYCSEHRNKEYEAKYYTTWLALEDHGFQISLQGVNYKGVYFFVSSIGGITNRVWYLNPRMEVVCKEGKLTDLVFGCKARQKYKSLDYRNNNLEFAMSSVGMAQRNGVKLYTIPLSGDKGFGHAAMVSEDCLEHVNNIKWNLNDGGYAQNSKLGLMHRYIMLQLEGKDAIKGKVIDHIDGDRLNNTIDNLRIATFKENAKNRTRNPESGYEGVVKVNRKYVCRIKDIDVYTDPDPRLCALIHDSVVTYVYGPGRRLNDNHSNKPISITSWGLSEDVMRKLDKLKSKHTDYRGVCHVGGRWKATINLNLGKFETAKEAARAHDIVSILLNQGETNFDESEYTSEDFRIALQHLLNK